MANRFAQAKVSKKVKFMNEDVEIVKLSVSHVLTIQEMAAAVKEDNEKDNIGLLLYVIRQAAPEFKDYTDAELYELPMEELTKLSGEIMKYSGLSK